MTFMRIRNGAIEILQAGRYLYGNAKVSDEDLRATLMESITKVPGLTSEQVDKIRPELIPIVLGIEPNGFDTNKVSDDFVKEMGMRGAPAGTWSLYGSHGGMCYRMHCSSSEKLSMAQEYEDDQMVLKMMVSEGFLQIKDYGQEDVQRVLVAAFPQSTL